MNISHHPSPFFPYRYGAFMYFFARSCESKASLLGSVYWKRDSGAVCVTPEVNSRLTSVRSAIKSRALWYRSPGFLSMILLHTIGNLG